MYFKCPGGSGKLICTCFTCLEGVWGAPDSANQVYRVGPVGKVTRAGLSCSELDLS